MLGPDSRLLTALLVMASVGLLVAAIRYRLLPVRILCSALSVVMAMTGGVAAVNYYYGYYKTWGALWADFHGTNGNLGVISAAATTTQLESGRYGWTMLAGKHSGYSRAPWCTCRRSTARPATRTSGSRSSSSSTARRAHH